MTAATGGRSGRRAGVVAFVLAAGGLLACGDDGPAAAPGAGAPTTVSADDGSSTTVGSADDSTGTGGEAGSELDRDQSDAASSIERRVAETLTDLDAQVHDGDTVITLPDQVLFAFDEHELLPEASATLDRIAEAIDYFAGAPVRVTGHTDARGSDGYNQTLSEQRAQAVVDHLVGAGVEPGRVTAEGLGETQPVAPNETPDGADDPDGRARNRRVEIVIEGVDPAELED